VQPPPQRCASALSRWRRTEFRTNDIRQSRPRRPGSCVLACETHEACQRDGYRCWTMNDGTRLLHACYPGADPLPDYSVGLPCEEDSACGAPHAQCATQMPYGSFSIPEITPAPGGYCTQPCTLDEECGAGPQCINVNVCGGLCMVSCSDAAPVARATCVWRTCARTPTTRYACPLHPRPRLRSARPRQ
jgi:hypothetical protein